MSGKVWMSGLLGNHDIGYKLGTRDKFFGRNWDPADETVPHGGKPHIENLHRYGQGVALPREAFPEASAVYNEKYFKKVGDLFCARGFFVVRGKLAEVLSRFDLGEGGLIPFPMFQADLVTPYLGEFFLLNFGARKNSVLPELCEDIRELAVDHRTGVRIWKINYLNETGKVVVSRDALHGPDLWCEETVFNKIFMSHALGQALIDIGMKDVFRLQPCTIVEGGQHLRSFAA